LAYTDSMDKISHWFGLFELRLIVKVPILAKHQEF